MPRFVGFALLAVLVSACGTSTDPGDGVLRYEGSLSIKSEVPIVVAGVVTVRNTSESVISIERNYCGYEMNLHSYASSNSAPVWKSEPTTCPGISLPLDLSPGSSYNFALEANLPSNLPNALYYLNVVHGIWRNGEPISLGNIVISNGKASR